MLELVDLWTCGLVDGWTDGEGLSDNGEECEQKGLGHGRTPAQAIYSVKEKKRKKKGCVVVSCSEL